ncbi:beta-ribofuranosylaminobenzene 5'-phosphate synthase family protein [Azospirillum halopraeferens]|uniref:beta-ribofuranosylaminobenzene 5'-phosphate synthase family protein n=1 Tax=Azospirillum halopraeferens TaxID=34010 RepID=UPI0003FD4EFC|nr:beta-ribofuranosylaminobenzene 5'-phosphate synthase family protein [Azospirillum halopraeferens]
MHMIRASHPAQEPAPMAAVSVFAPARLHLGFFDLDGALGRRFGSLGITLDELGTEVTVARSPRTRVEGPDGDRALAAYTAIARRLGLPDTAEITVRRAVPPHTGLGSGTQIALAAGTAAAVLAGVDWPARRIAALLGRGKRSGIGIAAFADGGVAVDGGCAPGGGIAPVICRMAFPEDWRIVLIFDHARQGVHGAAETAAFVDPPPFRDAPDLCRLMLMQALPALAEGDAERFGDAVGRLQRAMGAHFAPRQGGGCFTSPDVARALARFEAQGIAGVGQSSWGPTGFAIVGDAGRAAALAADARAAFADTPGLEFRVCRGRNRGADITPPGVAG